MTSKRRVVVVGSGMAATRLVEQLLARPGSSALQLTVLGDERHAPYNRILLSAVLEGTHRPQALTLRDPGWYAEHGVDLRLGTRVTAVDRSRQAVLLDDGKTVPYDTLVLATGTIPALPPIHGVVRGPGRLHEKVHAFRSLDDCRRLCDVLDAWGTGIAERRAVVVGGGLLGLQVARALAVRGLRTEIVEAGGHLLRNQLEATAGQILASELERLGTNVYTGVRGIRLTEAGLVLDTRAVLDTDLVVLTAGGRPSTGLAQAAGLTVRDGIVVDDQLRSVDDPRIHAIGDCAEHGGRTTGFVPPAWEQAGVLAAVLSGEDASYDGARQVARLRATDLDVAILGDPRQVEGEIVEVTNPVTGSYRKLVVRDGVVVGATLVGDLRQIGLITQYFDRGCTLGPAEPGSLVLAGRPPAPQALPDDAELCTCAGVSVGAVRACTSLDMVRETTRATTGCGGCAPAVRQLLATRNTAVPVTARGTP